MCIADTSTKHYVISTNIGGVINMNSKFIKWNEEKNQILKMQRGICFEQILDKLESGDILGRKTHPNTNKYPDQQIFIVDVGNYIYYVPFVETSNEIFLKTIIPSRKLVKEYGGNSDEK
jgi:hypothetical protein